MKRWKPRSKYSTPKLSKMRRGERVKGFSSTLSSIFKFIECAGKKKIGTHSINHESI